MAPTGTKFEVKKFDGTDDFGLWQTMVKFFVGTTGMFEGVAGCQARRTMRTVRNYGWLQLEVRMVGLISLTDRHESVRTEDSVGSATTT